MSYKNIFITLLIIIAVGLAAWRTLSYRPKNILPSPTRAIPDAFMENVTVTIFNKQGKPNLKMVTPKMVHYVENDATQITSPQLTLYRQSPQPWYISSQYAKATHGIEQIDFWNDVVIQHAGELNKTATVIKTPSLTVYPNKQVAKTIDLITLIQPNITVQAKGMYADLITGKINLLSQARGEYVPNS